MFAGTIEGVLGILKMGKRYVRHVKSPSPLPPNSGDGVRAQRRDIMGTVKSAIVSVVLFGLKTIQTLLGKELENGNKKIEKKGHSTIKNCIASTEGNLNWK
jgi:hypothetical protein